MLYILAASVLACVQEYRRLYGTVQSTEKISSKEKKSKKSEENNKK